MMSSRLGWTGAVLMGAVVAVSAQGRGGGAWTTVGGDAQRTSFVRTDPKISLASMQTPGFQFLWQRKLDTKRLTQPLLLPNIIAYKGFKALAFVGGASGHVYAIDYDLNRMFWDEKLATSVPRAAACSSGLPVLTKATPLTPPAGRGGGNRGGGPAAGANPPGAAGGRAAGAAADAPGRAGAPPSGTAPPAPAGGGVGGFGGQGGRGRGAGGPQIANGRGGGDNVFAISTGGMVHVMNPQVGTNQIPPVKLLPSNANVAGSILVDTTLYAVTTGNCSGVANGVWSVDLASDAKTVQSFDTKGATVAGAAPPAFGTDGTLYFATGTGKSAIANAVVSLEAKTLTQKDWFSASTPFTSNPIVFQYQGKDLIVAANKDGRLYVLDSASLGGADHKTPLHKSSPFTASADDPTGLASWLDAAGTRWVAATVSGPVHADTKVAMANGPVTSGTLVAFTVVDQSAAPTLQAQWTSRDLASPVTPVIVNGVVFALASGEAKGRGRPANAVLYALDAATGKELWTSGTTITSPVRGVGPSAGDSQVYVAASDGTLYAFGMPAER
jgi:outer membrane protein assembly factor BamB